MLRRAIGQWVDAVRRNHGLEHATVAVLLNRHGPSRMAGRASGDGFFLLADVDPAEVDSCAQEALGRMQAGEAGLAVSPLCGTNIVVTAALTAGATAAVLSTGHVRQRLPNALLAAMLGVVAGQPVGRAVQKHITTRADLGGVELVGTTRVAGPLLKVRTRAVTA